MEERLRTAFTDRGLIIHAGDGVRQLPLYAGAMHYWRIERRSWIPCLRAMKGLGFRLVDTYVPWGVHEHEAGVHAWNGDRDLGGFLDAVAEVGMHAILRPGPHVNAELTWFGFPERIVRDPDMQARTGRGTPVWLPVPPRMFPVPSYASAAFHAEVARWYRAVGEIAGSRLAPDGPVVAIQVDNEAQLFFRVGAYDQDYHPEAIAWWRDWSGDPDEPPRAFSAADAGRCARWVQFKEEYVGRALERMVRALGAAGLGGIARYHNLPPTEPTLANLPRLQRAVGGPVGIDFYHTRADYDVYRRRALYLAGSAAPLPFAPEVGVGGPPWLPPMSIADQESVILGLLAAGVRGLSFYMIVDRERWYGAPITTAGAARPPAAWIERLLTVLAEVDWPGLRRRAPIALVLSRAEARFGVASSIADPVTPVVAEFLGLGRAGNAELSRDPGAAEHRRWVGAVEEALALAQIPYDLVDEESPIERFADYRAVVMPTLDRVDRTAWRRLHEVAARGHVVVVGPRKPSRDEHDQPLGADAALPKRTGLIREGSRDDLAGLAQDLAGLAGELPDVWIAGEADGVDVSPFENGSGVVRVVFIANRTERALTADVVVPEGLRLRDPLAQEPMPHRAPDVVDVALQPHQVRLLIVEGEPSSRS